MKDILSIFLISIVSFVFAQKPDSIFHIAFDEASLTNNTIERVSKTSLPITNHFNRPERIPGIKGNALRLDGWSTFIETNTTLSVSSQMSIEAWFTTEAFSPLTSQSRAEIDGAAIISQQDDNSGFTLGVESFGEIYFEFYADGNFYRMETAESITKYEWNHITASIDLPLNRASVYLNGTLILRRDLQNESTINLSTTNLKIGQHNKSSFIAGINLLTLNGAIDELKIFDEALANEEVVQSYTAASIVTPNLDIDPNVRHQNDYLRPQYHVMPNTTWANESYGLSYYNNEYHLFFQKNPNAPFLHFMHWGHWTSPDLVDWEEEVIPLAPDKGWDEFGIWSGTTLLEDGKRPVIFYTGVNRREAGIGIAYAQDDALLSWEKYENNPVVDDPPGSYADFRDPYVWKDGDTYYMIVGAGFARKGALATYKSTDMIDWQVINPLIQGSNADKIGYYWEMPYFIRINDENEYILGAGPLFNNGPAQSIYWIGKWENETFTPYFDEPKFLELSRDQMLAASFGYDEAGRVVYLGIVPETRSEEDQIAAGWRQTFSLPRVVRLMKDSTLGTYPHPNLCRYREDQVSISDTQIEEGQSFNFPELGGNQIEVAFKILSSDSAEFELQLLKSADGSQYTAMNFNLEKNELFGDLRFASSQRASGNVRKGNYVFDHKDTIYVTAYIDHSIVEIFVDNTIAYSARVYPAEASQLVDIIVEKGTIIVNEAFQWNIKSLGSSSKISVCEPFFVPNELRSINTSEPETTLGSQSEIKFEIFPNPSDGKLFIEGKVDYIGLTNLSGQIAKFSWDQPSNEIQINSGPGLYILIVNIGDEQLVHKIIKK